MDNNNNNDTPSSSVFIEWPGTFFQDISERHADELRDNVETAKRFVASGLPAKRYPRIPHALLHDVVTSERQAPPVEPTMNPVPLDPTEAFLRNLSVGYWTVPRGVGSYFTEHEESLPLYLETETTRMGGLMEGFSESVPTLGELFWLVTEPRRWRNNIGRDIPATPTQPDVLFDTYERYNAGCIALLESLVCLPVGLESLLEIKSQKSRLMHLVVSKFLRTLQLLTPFQARQLLVAIANNTQPLEQFAHSIGRAVVDPKTLVHVLDAIFNLDDNVSHTEIQRILLFDQHPLPTNTIAWLSSGTTTYSLKFVYSSILKGTIATNTPFVYSDMGGTSGDVIYPGFMDYMDEIRTRIESVVVFSPSA